MRRLTKVVALVIGASALCTSVALAVPRVRTVVLSVGQSLAVRCPDGRLNANLATRPFTGDCDPRLGRPTRTTAAAPGAGNSQPCSPQKAAWESTADTGYTWPDGYITYNNLWNDPNAPQTGPGSQLIYACSDQDWGVVSEQPPVGQPANSVKTYPEVQDNVSSVPISSYRRLTSTFAETGPRVGDYEDAYDIWLNGIATSSSNEVMIWTRDHGQTPAGRAGPTVELGGRDWVVWSTGDHGYIAFVAKSYFHAGRVNLLALFKWLISNGYISKTSTVDQINYGAEICGTGGGPETFTFSGFHVVSARQ